MMKTIKKIGALVIIASTLIESSTLQAGLGKWIEKLMGGTCQYPSCKQEKEMHRAIQEQREMELAYVTYAQEMDALAQANVDDYNNVIRALHEVEALLGENHSYYSYANSLGAAAYKRVMKYFAKPDQYTRQSISDTYFSPRVIPTAHMRKELSEKLHKALGYLQQSIEYIKAHLDEERLRCNKIPLYMQVIGILKQVDALFGDDGKYYYYLNSGYGSLHYKKISDQLKQMVHENLLLDKPDVMHTDRYFVEALQENLKMAQKVLAYVKDHEAEEKARIDELKRKGALFDQAFIVMNEVDTLVNGIYDYIGNEYKNAAGLFQHINKKNNIAEFTEKTLQDALAIMSKTLASLRSAHEQFKAEKTKLEEEQKKMYDSLSPEEKQKFDALLKPAKEL